MNKFNVVVNPYLSAPETVVIEDIDFTNDAWLYVSGDFESLTEKIAYAQKLADILNSVPHCENP